MKSVNENAMNQQVVKVIVCCVLAGILVLALGVFNIAVIRKSMTDIVKEDMESETEEYSQRILKQMEKDLQSLETLATVLSYGNITDEQWFGQAMNEANQKNGFLTMAFFDKEAQGTIVYMDHGIRKNVDYRTLDKPLVQTVMQAYMGKSGVSKLFKSHVSTENIFAYSVPVYDLEKGNIKGVLAAGSTIDTFRDIIKDDTGERKTHALHLVNTQGTMLLSANVEDIRTLPADLFHSEFFSETEQQKIEEAFENEEQILTRINFGKQQADVYLNPVGINQWYIMYINERSKVNQTAYRMVNVIGVTFILMLGVIFFLLIHTGRTMVRNHKSLLRMAYQDPLTGADNITSFNQKLGTAKNVENGFCIAALNIHQFKFINEIFGVAAADRFLCTMKEIIDADIKNGEFYCRESGDLFYLFLKETEEEEARERIEAIIQKICGSQISEKADYRLMMYAGAVLWKPSARQKVISNEMLITRTRFAMQSGKKLLPNQVHFYDEEIHKNEEMGNYVETHMYQAMQKEEFKMYLQPQISLTDKKICGAEALVRWVTDDGRILFPDQFIPQFEANGFCVQLDLYMVEKACSQIRAWIDAGVEPVPISVNQSKLLFYEAGYLEFLKHVLEKYQIPANMITLEILEGLALDHADEINSKLAQLRKIGFKVSMDDFGSGYSSFHTLGKLQIDELKLDRSFLMEASATKEERFYAIMEQIITLSKRLKISTVAEGVESPENEDLIRMLGCDIGQGYLYSRPISADEFTEKYMEV